MQLLREIQGLHVKKLLDMEKREFIEYLEDFGG